MEINDDQPRLTLALEDLDNFPTNLESNLKSLSITGGLFTRIKNLTHLKNLRSLSITNSPLDEVDGLDRNYNLQTLLLDSNSIRALKKKNIGHLTDLQYLSLNDALVSNLWTTIDALKPLTNLRQLIFDSSPLPASGAEDFNDEEGQSEQNNEESLMSDLSEIENMLEEGSDSGMDEEGSENEEENSFSELSRWMQRAWDYGLIHKQRYYREFIIHHLPQLEILDEKIISAQEREESSEIVAKHFITSPFTEHTKTCKKSRNMPELLMDWQLGTVPSRSMATRTYRKHYAQYAQPKLTRLCEKYKPRQVEYNPTLPGLMLFGTINSEIGVVNYEKKKVLGLTSIEGNSSTVLGLCWLRSNPFRFVAGCDSGHINMFDVNDLIAGQKGALHQYARFPRLTSISVNATDELLLTSGYSRNVFVHDLNTSREVRTYNDCHNNYINSAKFANSVPYLFTTSSFDHSLKLFDIRDRSTHPIYTRETKNECLMVTWSPDDRYLLLSCADNEVTQFNAVDGSVNLAYPLKPINSEYNYTRSYYINRGQYIIVGSCEQAAIRICSTEDGRLLREVNFDGDAGALRLCCQSLRGSPHEDFRFSILVAEVLNYSDLKLYDVDLLHCE